MSACHSRQAANGVSTMEKQSLTTELKEESKVKTVTPPDQIGENSPPQVSDMAPLSSPLAGTKEAANVGQTPSSSPTVAKPTDKSESLTMKIVLVVITAVLAFLGAIGGTIVASTFESAKWVRETNYTYQQNILNKRIELLERTVKILNLGDAAKNLDLGARMSQYELITRNLSSKGETDQFWKDYLSSRLKLEDLDVEFSIVISLDRIYFGKNTAKAIEELTKSPKWWEAEDSKKQDLINAMGSELMEGIERPIN